MTSSVIPLPGLEKDGDENRLPVDQDITASAIIDLNGMIQSVNSDFTSLLHYSRHELANMRWTDCGHRDDADTEAAVMADLLVGTAGHAQLPRRLIAKDGVVVYGSLRLSTLRDSRGEPISLFAVFTAFATSGAKDGRYVPDSSAGAIDPPRIVAAAPAEAGPESSDDTGLKPSHGALRDPSDTPTDELLTLLNHEFRTPLNAIIGFAEMLDRETYGSLGDPHYREYARHIHESGERLLEFLSDMLDLVIGDNTSLQLSDDVIDPRAPLDAVLIGAEADDTSVDRIEHDTDRVADGTQLMADPQVMTRILSFLVADAIRSSGDSDQVSVTVDKSVGDGGLTYTILNAGQQPGTEPAETPFGRLADVKDGDRINTRLGLPLCKWLVRLHGGDLEVDRSARSGTKVHVRLPESRILRKTSETKANTAKLAV